MMLTAPSAQAATNGEKLLGTHMLQPFQRVDQSAWHVKERLELLDTMGIYAQILYPNGIGFASNHVFAIAEFAGTAILVFFGVGSAVFGINTIGATALRAVA